MTSKAIKRIPIGWADKNGRQICRGDTVEIRNLQCQVQKAILHGVVIYRFASHGIDIKEIVQWENYSNGVLPPETIWFLFLSCDKEVEIIVKEADNDQQSY